MTRPDTSNDVLKQDETSTRKNYSPLWKSRRVLNGQDNPRINHNRPQLDSLEIELDENVGDEKYLVSVVYASLGELPAFLFGWVEIFPFCVVDSFNPIWCGALRLPQVF